MSYLVIHTSNLIELGVVTKMMYQKNNEFHLLFLKVNRTQNVVLDLT